MCNRAPFFYDENYDYWKECMSIHIQSVDMDVRDVVTNGRYQPKNVVDCVAQDKPKADWSDDDKKKLQYDLKAWNILIYSFGVNEYHFVSHCETSKVMWDALEDDEFNKLLTIWAQVTRRMMNSSPPCKWGLLILLKSCKT